MKKIILLFISIITIGLTSVSCNKDDDNNSTATIEGKWIPSKEGETEATLTDYEHTAGCNKDYMIISSGGQISFYSYDNESGTCSESIDTGTWIRNGNTITISYEGVVVLETEIINLTSSELKTKDTADGFITVFTRG
ncbi:lipocalin-like domain-containing protein [Flavobacterium luteum]|uniref:Lipocalin family protein n=1 Tax=Flavobacterium luteum TaxID=2026654 RepID=A0A7J5AME8_9FLAO|nr:lipocalin family protein [Flavobacterium luteum]KAB1158159.1 lipocalin family protein [Flavobacterium luteum]